MSTEPDSGVARTLRNRLKALAYEALALLSGPPEKPFTVSARDGPGGARVTLAVTRADELPQNGADQGGQFFSPTEAAIVLALGPAGELIGKQIASKISQKYTPKLKCTLSNLIARKVLCKGEGGQAYRWHPDYRKKNSTS